MARLEPTWKILGQPEGPDLEKTQLGPIVQNIKAPLLDNDSYWFLNNKKKNKIVKTIRALSD